MESITNVFFSLFKLLSFQNTTTVGMVYHFTKDIPSCTQQTISQHLAPCVETSTLFMLLIISVRLIYTLCCSHSKILIFDCCNVIRTT